MILCDDWSDGQVKAFRLLVNRSVSWAQWDEELLALELQDIEAADFDVSLTLAVRVLQTPATRSRLSRPGCCEASRRL